MSDSENQLWAAYVKAVAGDETAQAIADRITQRVGQGVSQPTISRWLNGRYSAELKPGNVAAFAVAFDRPVLQAFVAAGLLLPNDARAGLDEEAIAFVLDLDRSRIAISGRKSRATREPRKPGPRPAPR